MTVESTVVVRLHVIPTTNVVDLAVASVYYKTFLANYIMEKLDVDNIDKDSRLLVTKHVSLSYRSRCGVVVKRSPVCMQTQRSGNVASCRHGLVMSTLG